MKIEQAIIENLRKLPIEKQQEVLTLTETLTKTHALPSPDPHQIILLYLLILQVILWLEIL